MTISPDICCWIPGESISSFCINLLLIVGKQRAGLPSLQKVKYVLELKILFWTCDWEY